VELKFVGTFDPVKVLLGTMTVAAAIAGGTAVFSPDARESVCYLFVALARLAAALRGSP
jgi:hypothetical protein